MAGARHSCPASVSGPIFSVYFGGLILGLCIGLLGLLWALGTPTRGVHALVALAAAPGRHLGNTRLTNVLSGTCWIAWFGAAITATSTAAGTMRRRPRLSLSSRGSATMWAVPEKIDGTRRSRRPMRRDIGRIEVPRPRSRAEMPSRRTGSDDDFDSHQPAGTQLIPETAPSDPLPPTSHASPPSVPAAASAAAAPVAPAAASATSAAASATSAAAAAVAPAAVAAPAVASQLAVSAVVVPVALDQEQRPVWPRPAPSVVPPGHLEDPEWSRAVLGLAAASGSGAELPLAWRFGATDAAAFVETAGSPPAPFVPHPCGVGWAIIKDPRLVASVAPSDVIGAGARSGLVTMWRDEGSRCLLDVVAARSVALDGPPVAVGYTLSDVVVELATRRWSDVAELYLVGFGREMHGLENVRYLPTVGDACAVVAGDRSGELGARCFVVAPIRTSDGREAELRRLLRLVEQTPATGVICCDTTVQAHCTWHLAAHRQTLRMEVRGRTRPAAVLTPESWVESTGVALRLAARSVTAVAALASAAKTPLPSVAAGATRHTPRSGIDVEVLGPVQVEGAIESFEGRRLLTELVVYLAFHPEGLTGEAFATALWPERRVPLQTLANRLHEARRALGRTEHNAPRLTRSEGRHLLAPDVRTDWSRFVALTRDGSGPASWRQAVSLVRGRPFEGLAKGDWAVFEGFVAAIEAAIVDVSARLGEHLLDAGDPLGAEWAIRQGLLAAPWDERLYRLLMSAADSAGNRGGVESALRSLAHVLDHPGDPLEIVHPETAALYRRLTGTRAGGRIPRDGRSRD